MLIPDTLLVCGLIVAWGGALVGWGLAIAPFGRSTTPETAGTLGDSGLLGLMALSVLGCVANFFMPLGGWPSAVILLSGWGLLIVNWRLARAAWRYAPNLPLAALLAFAIPTLAMRLVSPKFLHSYDTGLYHLQTILTTRDSALVLGLANLHSRFGYNSLWLVLSAGLSLPVFEMQSMFIANILVAIFSMVAILQRLVRSADPGFSISQIFGFGSAVICPAIVILLPVHSPNTDLAPALLVIEVFYIAIIFIERSSDLTQRANRSAELALVIMFSAFAITLKTSQLMICLVPLALIVAIFLGGLSVAWRPILWAGVFSAILLMAWDLRGVGLSGCVFYPAASTCLAQLPWSVPPESAARELALIKAWARNPGADAEKTLSNWQWLRPWALHLLRNPVAWLIAALTALTATASLLFDILSRRSSPAMRAASRSTELRLYLSLSVCSAIGVCFWFLSSPDLRFALGFLVALPLIGASIAFCLSPTDKPSQSQSLPKSLLVLTSYLRRQPAISAFVIASVAILAHAAFHRNDRPLIWPIPPHSAVVKRLTYEGRPIYVPASGDQCWDAMRPCTPYFDPSLRFGNFGRWQMIAPGVRHPVDSR